MALLESRLDRRSESFAANAQRMERLVGELRERLAAVRAGGGAEAIAKHRKRNKLTARERIERLVDPGSRLSRALGAGGHSTCTTTRSPVGRNRHRHRHRRRTALRHRRQRRDRQRRHLLPDDGQEASARARDRRTKPSAVHLFGRFGRRVLAVAGRRFSRPRPLRTNLLQPSAHVGQTHPADRRGHGIVHRGRRVRAGDERRDGDRQGRTGRSFWAARRW